MMFKEWFKKENTENSLISRLISSNEKRLGRLLKVEERMELLNHCATLELIELQSRREVVPIEKCLIITYYR